MTCVLICPTRRREATAKPQHGSRMQLAALLWAYALEPTQPAGASRARAGALALHWVAALQGDEATPDFRTGVAHAQLLTDLRAVAAAAESGVDPEPAMTALLERYLGATRGALF